ncbi:hypothetical protein CPJ18_02275 [Agrobacterium rosae]|uniref:Uncharacterized protein n=1 Tax=Agrobacterium rosae TaxID=1972867 RepID=A0AAE5S257_9HYPH|nr:hypothetical protein [Agrobacterium rosae]POO54343.1 hypothetical protein CPJ18_02275 [Agrobacterium rosae]
MVMAIKKALEDLNALVAIVANDTGALVMSDPDEDSVGSTLEGDLEMTFGHVRRAHAAVADLEAALSTDAKPVKPASSVAVKTLEWKDIEASSPTGHYRVQRLDDKWEPLHNGYYMLPRVHGVVIAFDTQHEAKAHCQQYHDAAIRSALSARVQDVADTETYYTTENNWENMFFGPGASTIGNDLIWDFAKQTWANADFKITVTAAPAAKQVTP